MISTADFSPVSMGAAVFPGHRQ